MKKLLVRLALCVLIALLSMSFVTALADYSRIANAKMPIYSSSSMSKKVGTVPKWTVVLVKSINGSVAKVSVNGKKGYTDTAYLADAYDISHYELYGTLFVTKKCKVYSYPSTKAKAKTVKKGLEVEIIKTDGKMYLIRTLDHNYMAYIPNIYLSMNP